MTMTMMNRKRTRVTLATALLLLSAVIVPSASAFTVIQQSQSHDRSRSNRHLYRQVQPPRTTSRTCITTGSHIHTRRYLAPNSNNGRRYNQTAHVPNETKQPAPVTATRSSSSVSLDDNNDELNDSNSRTSTSSDNDALAQKPDKLQPLQVLPEPKLLRNNENDTDIESVVDEFQNEIDKDDLFQQELKQNIQGFLREPIVEVVDFCLVLLSCFLVAVSTIPDLAVGLQAPIQFAENTIGSVFAVEFLARWYSHHGVQSDGTTIPKKGLLYFAQPSVLVDIVAVILPLLFATQPSSFWADSTFVPNWLTSSSGLINLRLLRILRLQRVLQDMDTFTKFEVALGISDSNVKAWQLQLARTVLSIFTLLSVSTGLIYTAEHDVNPNIPDYFTALYFGLTTLTTVGFGDIVPVSWQGRLVVSGSILAGVAVIPAQAAVLVEALLARQEERQAAIQSQTLGANLAIEDEDENEDDSNAAMIATTDSTATLTPTSDPVRQEVAAQAAKRRHTLVHGSNDNDDVNDNASVTAGRMVLETEFACPSCRASMHWSSAKFCWSCGEQIVD
jgi:hypothetical protein